MQKIGFYYSAKGLSQIFNFNQYIKRLQRWLKTEEAKHKIEIGSLS